MKSNLAFRFSIAMACVVASSAAAAECAVSVELKTLDPVEVGFCESDAVFVGKVTARMETARAFRAEGEERTVHFRTETSTVEPSRRYKGNVPDRIKMTAQLYDKGETYSFVAGKEYLIFAKKLSSEDQYSGATEKCSVQPTLLVADAAAVIVQLEQIKRGKKRVDCKNLQPKAAQ